MCFVLDVNSFPRMFKPNSDGYKSFEPLRDWLYKKKGTCIVYGGTSYKKELGRLSAYMNYLTELKKLGKLRTIQDGMVDTQESRVKKIIPAKKFDDAHLVAIFCASGCRILATQDGRADKYISDLSLYPEGRKPPRVYRNASHEGLLTKKHIVKLANQS